MEKRTTHRATKCRRATHGQTRMSICARTGSSSLGRGARRMKIPPESRSRRASIRQMCGFRSHLAPHELTQSGPPVLRKRCNRRGATPTARACRSAKYWTSNSKFCARHECRPRCRLPPLRKTAQPVKIASCISLANSKVFAMATVVTEPTAAPAGELKDLSQIERRAKAILGNQV